MSAPVRVLLVEDSEAQAKLVVAQLTKSIGGNFQVEVVSRLREALQQLESHRPHIVLLDLSLPDADGVEGIIAIRSRDTSVPIVVLSSQSEMRIAVEALHSGAQDYLVKGAASGDVLLRSIRHAIERMSLSRAAHMANGMMDGSFAGQQSYILRSDGGLYAPFAVGSEPVAMLRDLAPPNAVIDIQKVVRSTLQDGMGRTVRFAIGLEGRISRVTAIVARIDGDECLLVISAEHP